jgi:hypothetical protein
MTILTKKKNGSRTKIKSSNKKKTLRSRKNMIGCGGGGKGGGKGDKGSKSRKLPKQSKNRSLPDPTHVPVFPKTLIEPSKPNLIEPKKKLFEKRNTYLARRNIFLQQQNKYKTEKNEYNRKKYNLLKTHNQTVQELKDLSDPNKYNQSRYGIVSPTISLETYGTNIGKSVHHNTAAQYAFKKVLRQNPDINKNTHPDFLTGKEKEQYLNAYNYMINFKDGKLNLPIHERQRNSSKGYKPKLTEFGNININKNFKTNFEPVLPTNASPKETMQYLIALGNYKNKQEAHLKYKNLQNQLQKELNSKPATQAESIQQHMTIQKLQEQINKLNIEKLPGQKNEFHTYVNLPKTNPTNPTYVNLQSATNNSIYASIK